MKLWPSKRRDAAALLDRLRAGGFDLFEVRGTGELRLVPSHHELQVEVNRLREPLRALIAGKRQS